MNKRMKLAALAVATVLSFVAIANTAVIWHGAVFIPLVALWGYGVNVGLDAARR